MASDDHDDFTDDGGSYIDENVEIDDNTSRISAVFNEALEIERELILKLDEYKEGNSTVDTKRPQPEEFIRAITAWLSDERSDPHSSHSSIANPPSPGGESPLSLPDRAEAMLDRMEELYEPPGRIYERIVNSWCDRALELLEQSQFVLSIVNSLNVDSNQNDNINIARPDDFIGNSDAARREVVAICRNAGALAETACGKAYALLDRMEQLYGATGDFDFRPALSTYNAVTTGFKRKGAILSAISSAEGMGNGETAFAGDQRVATVVDQIRRRKDAIYNIQPPSSSGTPSPTHDTQLHHSSFSTLHQRQPPRVFRPEWDSDVFNFLFYLDDNSRRKAFSRLKTDDSLGQTPTVSTKNFNVVIHALASAKDKHIRSPAGSDSPSSSSSSFWWAAEAAEGIFDYMVQRYQATLAAGIRLKSSTSPPPGGRTLKPNLKTINGCIKAWAKLGGGTTAAAERAAGILEKLALLQVGANDGKDAVDDDDTLFIVDNPDLLDISTIAKGNVTTKSTQFLLPQQQESNAILQEIIPDNVSYNTVMHAYALAGDPDHAEQILKIMEVNYLSEDNHLARPDMVSYGTVLNAYARAAKSQDGAVKKAEDVLWRMYKGADEKGHSNMMEGDSITVSPNTWCFNTVLNAHAVRGCGKHATLLVKLMEDMVKRGNSDVHPDTYTYNTVLKALSNSQNGVSNNLSSAKKLLSYMEKIPPPQRIRTKVKNDNNMNIKQSSSLMTPSVRPDSVSYNTVIDMYAKHGGKNAGREAELILRRMEERFQRNGYKECCPTIKTYTSVINAYARSQEKGAAPRAEAIVASLERGRMQSNIRPDVTIYNSLINCWAKSTERGSTCARRAEEILHYMESRASFSSSGEVGGRKVDYSRDTWPRPNCRTYTTVIHALAKSGQKNSAHRALIILNRMENGSDGEAGTTVKPSVHTYGAVISCIARSEEVNKASMAMGVLQRMEEEYRRGNASASPNSIAYNGVLNACAHTSDAGGNTDAKKNAFGIACLVFDEMRTSDHVQCTHITYGTFLSVCAKLMPVSEMRDKLGESIFRRIRREGLVSRMVLKQIRVVASPGLFKRIVEDELDESMIPLQWCRNVDKRERAQYKVLDPSIE